MKMKIKYLVISILSLLLALAMIHFGVFLLEHANPLLNLGLFLLMISFFVVSIAFFIKFLIAILSGVALTYLKGVVVFGILALGGILFGLNALERGVSSPWPGICFGFAFVCILLIAILTYDFIKKITGRGE